MKIIMYGHTSTEHDISIITACLFARADYGKVYINKQGEWLYYQDTFTPAQHLHAVKGKRCILLPNSKWLYEVKGSKLKKIGEVEAAVLCFHGGKGEDGCMQGLLELCGIPYLSPSPLACALTMDKCASKTFLKGLGIPVVRGISLTKAQWLLGGKRIKIGFPLVVKPSRLGSSIGVAVANSQDELAQCLNTAFAYDDKVIIERAVTDYEEVYCALLQGETTEFSRFERRTAQRLYTFENKYLKGQKYAKITETHPNQEVIYSYAAKIASALELKGVIRIDFFVTQDKVYVNEINAIPGNLAYHLFEHRYTKQQYLNLLVAAAQKQKQAKDELITTFSSSVLEQNDFATKK